ncbi:hypothetical protein Ancab_018433 [Ancistrocladus abbreviatus]
MQRERWPLGGWDGGDGGWWGSQPAFRPHLNGCFSMNVRALVESSKIDAGF